MKIIAHRGAAHAYPENTRVAFDAALAEGADGLELDLQLSADDVPVIFHDDRLEKLGHPRARIRDFTLAQLYSMDSGRWFGAAPARLLSLHEVMDAYADKTRLYLEIKHTERRPARHRVLAEAVARCLRQYPQAVGISVLSFHWKALAAIMEMAPEVACIRNLDSRWGASMLRRDLPRLAGVCVNIERFGPAQTAMLNGLGKPLYGYTCDTREQLALARRLGITHVITNYPARTREWLADMG